MQTTLPTGITPRMLSEEAAAVYMNLDPKSFRKLVDTGMLPKPVKFNGVRRNLYDRKKLDAHLDGISGLNSLDEQTNSEEAGMTPANKFRDNIKKRRQQ